MTNKDQIREIGALILIGMILLIPTAVLFFSDGGEIRGITERSEPTGENRTIHADGLMFVPVHEEIRPVYEDDPARARELWQLPPRDILMELITYPFTYIPPSVAKILSLLYLASGLAFLILYRKKTSRKDPEPASRRELIRTYIHEHPGRNKQEIAAALSLPRSSLNYHLNRLQKTQDILEIRYGKQLHFLPANIGLTDNQKILLSLLSREKDHLIFQTLLTQPSLTRNEIAAELNLSTTTVVWYIRKLKRSHLLTTQKQERKLRYSLTPEVVTAYQNLAKIRTPPFDGPSTCLSLFSKQNFPVSPEKLSLLRVTFSLISSQTQQRYNTRRTSHEKNLPARKPRLCPLRRPHGNRHQKNQRRHRRLRQFHDPEAYHHRRRRTV